MVSREQIHRAILAAYRSGNRLMLLGERRSGRLSAIRDALPAAVQVHVLDLSLACDDAGVDFAANRLSHSKGQGYAGLVSNLDERSKKTKQVLVIHNIDGPSTAEPTTVVTGYVRSQAQVAQKLGIIYTASRLEYVAMNVAAANAPLLRQANIVAVPRLNDQEIGQWAAETVGPVDVGYVKLLGGTLFGDLKLLLARAHKLSTEPQKALTEAAIQIAEARNEPYSQITNTFLTPNFLRILVAMASGAPGRAGGKLARCSGVSLGSLTTSLQRLSEIQILYKDPTDGFRFNDPFFRVWLLRGQRTPSAA